jgi:hypothetical protein
MVISKKKQKFHDITINEGQKYIPINKINLEHYNGNILRIRFEVSTNDGVNVSSFISMIIIHAIEGNNGWEIKSIPTPILNYHIGMPVDVEFSTDKFELVASIKQRIPKVCIVKSRFKILD